MRSKALYAFTDGECTGIVWETLKGTIVTIEGMINPQNNLSIVNCDTGEEITDIDWRNILMDILPFK